jgi:hypothetical protein
MGGSVSDWPLLCRRSLEHLNPGGWFEIQDYDTAIYAYNDPDLETAPRTREWQVLVNLAAERSGRTMNVVSGIDLPPWSDPHVSRHPSLTGGYCVVQAHRQKQWMIEAGYQDVHEEVVQVSKDRERPLSRFCNPLRADHTISNVSHAPPPGRR